jgi:hypothetical protein
MRILSAPEAQMPEVRDVSKPKLQTKAPKPQVQAKKKIKLSWEDVILGIALLVIIVSWITGAFGPDQVLAYLGFTATGGIWGYFSGKGGD